MGCLNIYQEQADKSLIKKQPKKTNEDDDSWGSCGGEIRKRNLLSEQFIGCLGGFWGAPA